MIRKTTPRPRAASQNAAQPIPEKQKSEKKITGGARRVTFAPKTEERLFSKQPLVSRAKNAPPQSFSRAPSDNQWELPVLSAERIEDQPSIAAPINKQPPADNRHVERRVVPSETSTADRRDKFNHIADPDGELRRLMNAQTLKDLRPRPAPASTWNDRLDNAETMDEVTALHEEAINSRNKPQASDEPPLQSLQRPPRRAGGYRPKSASEPAAKANQEPGRGDQTVARPLVRRSKFVKPFSPQASLEAEVENLLDRMEADKVVLQHVADDSDSSSELNNLLADMHNELVEKSGNT